ncbi:MAG: DUF4112 domain-containing protein [bacterium]|nr:DUF4112 domain-containing protein [bacterium]
MVFLPDMKKDTYDLKNARRIAVLMDSKYSIFGIKFGLDSVIGFIPGLGDAVTITISSYLVWIAIQSGVPAHKLIRMIGNLGIDSVLGLVPILGDVVDIFYKANLKNLQILEDHFASLARADAKVVEGEVVE